ncbi:MAG: hypothetical protein K5639_07325 [Eubacterium sp.]|nr:hypothetical protein [Eubacterium sp.]
MDEKRFIARIILIKAVKKSFIKVSSEYGRRYPVLKYPIFVLNILASVLINFYIRLVTFFHKVRIGYGRNREVFARVVAIMIAATFIVSGVDGVYNGVAHGIGAASGQAVEVGSGMDEDTDEGDNLQDETDDSGSDVSDDSSENDADDDSAQDSGDAGEADDEEGGEAEKIDESEAGFVASSYVKNEGVTVTVIADKNVFPANCSLSVRTVTRKEGATVDEAVDEKRDDDRNFVSSYTYDIKIIDSEGNEIEPDTDKGKVRVIFEIDEVKNDNLKADIYHIKNEDDDLRAEKLETEKGLYENKEVAAAETDGFSYYTVEFTYGRKQYVMEGDTEVLLSDILDEVGLSGEVSDARVSDDTLFSAFKDGGVWKVQALQAFDTEETLTVLIDGVEYVIEVTDDPGNQQSGYKVLLWLAENDSTGITTYSKAVTDIFASAGVTVKEVKKNVITAEDIADVQMVYMLMWRSAISVNDNKELLKGFVNKGGRIVMNGENPGCAPDGNRCFSSLAAELGAGFEIQSKYEATGNPVVLNTASSLVDNAEGATPIAAAHINTFGDAVWVAKVKGNKNDGSDDVVFIADQKAGKGYITVFSDVNFFHHSTIQPAGAAILNNLLTDSVKNIEKVNANPHIETDNITILSATSHAYYRLLDENGNPLTKDNTGISAFDKDGNDVSIHIDNNGWIQGVGAGEETDILNIRGLTHDTPYVLQTVSDEGYNSGNPE